MSARRSERIMNLAICLLMARRFISREQIRATVEGYRDMSDASFERTFERDKEELRGLGVPVETGSNSPLFPDEVGYRIRRTDFELPPLEFTSGELAALGLASRVWDSARLADDSVRALAKLRAAGVEPDAERLTALAPSVGAHEPAFEPLWTALMARRRVRIMYHGLTRVVQPWTLAYRRGSWYLLAFDETRDAERLFKVARIEGAPVPLGDPDAYAIPPGDLSSRFESLEPTRATREVTLAIADAAAPDLRRRGRRVDWVVPNGRTAYAVDFPESADIAGDLASRGPDVLVLAPDDVRSGVIARLEGIAG